jgi:hypothetical protein
MGKDEFWANKERNITLSCICFAFSVSFSTENPSDSSVRMCMTFSLDTRQFS